MGAIRTAVKQFDVAPAVASEQRELVEALAQLAATKADAFALEIEKYIAEANTDFNRSLPVESWLDTTKETHAMSSESHDLVIEELDEGCEAVRHGVMICLIMRRLAR